jgi:2',3'-cyclic-nucleotide 2'-phosphodiesterase (5'-nucleotidase family)
VIGNRETHVLASAFERKLEGASHPVLCANLRRKDGTHALGRSLVVEAKGVRVGIIGVMVPMVTSKMAAAAASAFLWDSPIPEAARLAEELRMKVDLLVALTHIGHRQDLLLAEACSSFDAILGGHSHTVLSSPVMVGRTAVCQGGSHCRYAGLYEWSAESGWTGGLRELA